jgi:hypothetical protein
MEREEETTMLSQQTRYTTPREEIRAEMPPQPVDQRPTPPEDNERFIVHSIKLRNGRFALSMVLIIVSMAFMVAAVGILLSEPALTAVGVTGALIGIGIAGLVLVCINVLFNYMLFSRWKE